MKKNIRIINKIFVFLIILIMSFICTNIVYAEGSKDLKEDAPASSYRAYLEWQTGNTLGIPRENFLKVYAKSGEVIKFGSSVYNSYDNQDIIVRYPDNSIQVYDVLQTGLKYIDTVEKENVGPFPDLGGYTPLELNVNQTGIYVFQFHGPIFTGGTAANPAPVTVNQNFLVNQASNVAAWDITVEQNEAVIEGRVYLDYLALNEGREIGVTDILYTHVYVLTQDGYIYRTSLDNVDPFGFIIYSNNRGLVNGNTNTALYHSARVTNNNFTELIGNIQVPQPQNGDTGKDIFHKIFFNLPANDLPENIPIVAIPPTQATNFKFTGIADEITDEGMGGYFSFDTDRVATYQIEIDVGSEIILIGNTTQIGANSIYWNGRDSMNNIIPQGEYTATIKVKGGEYHFPFFDVENSNGITIQLLNPPYVYPGFNLYMVYYNNDNYFIGETFVDLSGVGITNPVDASIDGVDSLDPNSVSYTNSYGNEKVIDIWTFFNSENQQLTFRIIGQNESYVSGFVFNDINKNGVYDNGDEPLPNVQVQIELINTGEIITVYTNEEGVYSDVLEYGEYRVTVIAHHIMN